MCFLIKTQLKSKIKGKILEMRIFLHYKIKKKSIKIQILIPLPKKET